MSDMKDKRTFTFEITGFTSEEVVPMVRSYLQTVFPEQPPEAIERALERRPLRFRAQATPERAVRLQQALVSRGALATVSEAPIPAASPAERAAGPEGAPAGTPPPEKAAAEASAETDAAREAETGLGPTPPEEAGAEVAPSRETESVSEPSSPVETGTAPGAETTEGELPPEPPPPVEAPAASFASAAPAPESAVTQGPLPDAPEAPPLDDEAAPEETPLFFWNAWAAAIFSPRRFFRTLYAPGGALRALLFAAVLGLLATVLSFPARMFIALNRGLLDEASLTERYLTSVFTDPLATVIATCLVAWLLHLGLRFMAGPRPFEVTLKVVAYTTAAGVFAAIPRAGSGIAALLTLLLTLVGLSSAQRVRPIQAMGAVLFPVLLLGAILLITLGGLALGGFLVLETLRS